MKTSKSSIQTPVAAAFALAVGLGLAAPTVASAQDDDATQHTGISIGGRAAYYHNNHAINNDWYGGAQLRFHLAPAVALEGSVDYNQTRAVNYYPVQASLLIYLTPQYRLTPYILGGGGWYFTDARGVNQSPFGPHAGAGLELALDSHWSIDGSWRYLWLEDPNSGSNYFNRTYSTNGYMFTGGLNFRF